MRCPRCQFENIPGQERCVRCHSILEAGVAVTEVHPPRMHAWRRPFRAVARRLRRYHALPLAPSGRRAVRGLGRVVSSSLFALVLSVIPGLGHLVTGRLKEVRLLLPAWLVLLSCAVFCYGGGIGFLCLGLAIGVHAWIAVRAGFLNKAADFRGQVGIVGAAVLVLALVYWAAPRVLLPGYAGVHTALAVPGMKIQAGDYLLVRRISGASGQFSRGDLVMIHPPLLLNARRDIFDSQRTMTVGQIVGLGGEGVQIQDGVYTIGRQRLDPEQFPVPAWLQSGAWSIGVPADAYFVSSPYRVSRRGAVLVTADMIRSTSLFTAKGIRGKAFMRWWPLPKSRIRNPEFEIPQKSRL